MGSALLNHVALIQRVRSALGMAVKRRTPHVTPAPQSQQGLQS